MSEKSSVLFLLWKENKGGGVMKELIENIVERVEKLTARLGCWSNDDGFDTELLRKEDVLDIIHEEAKAYNNGWIPCSERLPEIDGNTSDVVLVCTVDGFQHMAFWCDDEKWRYCESGMIKNTMEWTEIIAWQPLPAPYQPKGE